MRAKRGRFSVKYTDDTVAGVISNALKVLGIDRRQGKTLYVFVRCECGTKKSVRFEQIRKGALKSCGCAKTHAQSFAVTNNCSDVYRAWVAMRQRCGNPRSPKFHHYGGRGISVCDRWRSFENFYADMGPRPSRRHSLDRYPNNNGNYEPGNCRWATQKEQLSNRRVNHIITVEGVTRTVTQWAEFNGWRKGAIFSRLNRGMNPEDAVTVPLDKTSTPITFQGETLCLAEWSRRTGIASHVLLYRFHKKGWRGEQLFQPLLRVHRRKVR